MAAAAVSAAARSVLTASVALHSVHDIEDAFGSASCSAAIASLLGSTTLPACMLSAACRAAGFQLGADSLAFLRVGGPAALVALLRRPEPTVVVASCAALQYLDPFEGPQDVITSAMVDGGGCDLLCSVLSGELGCLDDVVIAVCRAVPRYGNGLDAFNAAGGMEILAGRVSTASSSANCAVFEAVCAFFETSLIFPRSLAMAFVGSGGVVRLLAELRRGGGSGPPPFSAVRALAACSVLARISRPPESDDGAYPAMIEGLSERFIAAGGHIIFAALMDVRGAAGTQRHRRKVVEAACSILVYMTKSPRGKAVFAAAGGVERAAFAVAWFLVGASPLRSRMYALVTLAEFYGVMPSAPARLAAEE